MESILGPHEQKHKRTFTNTGSGLDLRMKSHQSWVQFNFKNIRHIGRLTKHDSFRSTGQNSRLPIPPLQVMSEAQVKIPNRQHIPKKYSPENKSKFQIADKFATSIVRSTSSPEHKSKFQIADKFARRIVRSTSKNSRGARINQQTQYVK